MAKTGTGPCEQIRVLLVERRSAMKARVAAHRQITALLTTAPDAVRTRFARLSGEGAHRRPGPHAPRTDRRHPRIDDHADTAPPGPPPPDPDRRDHRHRHRAARTDRPRRPDDARHQGAAPSTTATLLAGAGDNPDRIRSEASFAALCGAAPIPASPREDQPPPTQPRRRPTGQLGAAPDRPGPPVQRPAHQGLRRPPHRHGQEPQRDPALPPNAPSPAKHGTCRPTPDPHPAPTTCAEGATNEDSPPAQAAHHLNTHPARISELERGTRPDTTLTAAYRQWLSTQQPQTHTT